MTPSRRRGFIKLPPRLWKVPPASEDAQRGVKPASSFSGMECRRVSIRGDVPGVRNDKRTVPGTYATRHLWHPGEGTVLGSDEMPSCSQSISGRSTAGAVIQGAPGGML